MKKEIKAFFKNHPGIRIKSKELGEKLGLKSDHSYEELKHFLFQLTTEGFLEKQGKRFEQTRIAEEKLIGTVQILNEGDFAFVSMKNAAIKDVFIAGKNLTTALDGDLVEVILFEKKRGKNIEGAISSIVERGRKEIVGTLHKSKSFYFVHADDLKIHRDIYIFQNALKGAKPGDKVVVNKIDWKNAQLNPEGEVSEILGKTGTYDVEIASIAREFNLAYKFSDQVLKEAEAIPIEIPKGEIKKRLDLRNKIVFTIDPDDAKDFDDAVSVEINENGNFLVGIHIADVSHFVQEGSHLYEEALERGTSVYLVGKVIPMLPEKLSNRICSLVPNEDRLTYSVIVEISPRGKVVEYKISKTIINSKRRFTYNEVQEIIETGIGELAYEIATLNKISKMLRTKRMKKGSINFYSPEVVFKLDNKGTPTEIIIKEVRESHNLIEELMLLANQIIAEYLQSEKNKSSLPFVYRIHDLPDKEKITEFARFVKSLGYKFDPNAANKSRQFQELLDNAKGSPEEAVINEIAIRSMAKAEYSTTNIGHYGLGFAYYTHFTSPIRRFPDLIVHQLIFKYLSDDKGKNLRLEELDEICNHASSQERNAVNAERLSVKLKQIEFLKNKVGKEVSGIISGITHFGIFVELSETLAEGLIRFKDLDDDYYTFDEKNYSVIGRRSKRQLRLGDKVTVQIIRVDEERRIIDFALCN